MTDRPQAACGGSTDEQGPHYAVRRARIARDVLRDWDGALAVERDRHRMGARAVARGPESGTGHAAKDRGERPMMDSFDYLPLP
jgi:hypothetical protein